MEQGEELTQLTSEAVLPITGHEDINLFTNQMGTKVSENLEKRL